MLKSVAGAIWVLLGLWWLVKPEKLKKKLQRKMSRRLRRAVIGLVVVFAFFMLGVSFEAPGLLTTLTSIFVMTFSIKLIFYFKDRANDRFLAWCGMRPVWFFRVFSISVIMVGAFLIIS